MNFRASGFQVRVMIMLSLFTQTLFCQSQILREKRVDSSLRIVPVFEQECISHAQFLVLSTLEGKHASSLAHQAIRSFPQTYSKKPALLAKSSQPNRIVMTQKRKDTHSVFCSSDVPGTMLSILSALTIFSLRTAAPFLNELTVAQKVQPLLLATSRMWIQMQACLSPKSGL